MRLKPMLPKALMMPVAWLVMIEIFITKTSVAAGKPAMVQSPEDFVPPALPHFLAEADIEIGLFESFHAFHASSGQWFLMLSFA